MKNFNFKSKKSVIKTLKEPPKAKKINWQKWSWMAILVAIFSMLGMRIFNGVAIVRGKGQVELEKQAVNFTDDIRLLKIFVKEGQQVELGDTLFLYKRETEPGVGGVSSKVTINKPVDWIEKERLSLKKQIALKKIERDNLTGKIKFKEEEFKHQQDLVLLGVNNIEYTLTSIESDILSLKTKKKMLEQEVYYLRKHLYQLRKQEKDAMDFKQQELDAQQGYIDQIIPYIAKTSGIVGNVNFSDNEACYEKQDVVTIHKKDEISILAYFHPELTPYLQINEVLQIKFPDGTKGLGRVNNIYISTYALPSEFQNKYEPTQRNVVVDVLPLTPEEGKRWVNFYKMTVDIKRLKYEFW